MYTHFLHLILCVYICVVVYILCVYIVVVYIFIFYNCTVKTWFYMCLDDMYKVYILLLD